jgi:hypothetical protein
MAHGMTGSPKQGMSREATEDAARAIAPDRSLWQRFILSSQLELQADFGYIAAREYVEACGLSIARLDEYLAATDEMTEKRVSERLALDLLTDRYERLNSAFRDHLLITAGRYLEQQEEDERARERSRADRRAEERERQ